MEPKHLNTSLWKNVSAAISMLYQCVQKCPNELWTAHPRYFYLVYHTTIFLDYYLTVPVRDFAPSLPYSLGDPDDLPENAVDDVLPVRQYSQSEVTGYLDTIRNKAEALLTGATPKQWSERWIAQEELDLHLGCPSLVADYTLLEICLYNLRHVQHHVGQLNLILRQESKERVDWI